MCVHKFEVHYGSAFELGAFGLPFYCTPPVCVPDVLGALAVWRHVKIINVSEVIELLAVWRHNKPKTKKPSCGSAFEPG